MHKAFQADLAQVQIPHPVLLKHPLHNEGIPGAAALHLFTSKHPLKRKAFFTLFSEMFGKLDDLVHISNVILIVREWQSISANMKCDSLPVNRVFKALSTSSPELIRNKDEKNSAPCFSLRSSYAWTEWALENYLNLMGEGEENIILPKHGLFKGSSKQLAQHQGSSSAYFPLPTPLRWQTPAPQSHLWCPRVEAQRASLQTPGCTDGPELRKTGASKSPDPPEHQKLEALQKSFWIF